MHSSIEDSFEHTRPSHLCAARREVHVPRGNRDGISAPGLVRKSAMGKGGGKGGGPIKVDKLGRPLNFGNYVNGRLIVKNIMYAI